MKKINILLLTFSLVVASFAQSNSNIQVKRSAKEAPLKLGNTEISIQPRSVDCLWESDFTNEYNWVLDHDATDCSLDWQIGENLQCQGFYPIPSIESENGYYALLDTDAYGGEEGGTEKVP